jgi:hypothetical protein
MVTTSRTENVNQTVRVTKADGPKRARGVFDFEPWTVGVGRMVSMLVVIGREPATQRCRRGSSGGNENGGSSRAP